MNTPQRPSRQFFEALASGAAATEARVGPPQWTVADPSRGLGDTLAKATAALGIKPCNGCKERQVTFNRWFPYAAQRGEKE